MNMSSYRGRNKSAQVFSLGHYTWDGNAFRKNLTDAANLRANTLEFFFNALIAAINVVDAVKDRFPIRYQRGDDQRCGGAKIRALNCGSAERRVSNNSGATAFDFDVRTHARQFLRVHEAIFKNIFRDD